MDNIQNSYPNRTGYPGSLALTALMIFLAIFMLGGATFSEGDKRQILVVLFCIATFFGVASAGLWWEARTRALAE